MAEWVLSIVGVVALTVLLDILLPEGQMNKYLKGIFSLLVILVVISPLPSLVKNGTFEDFFKLEKGDFDVDYEKSDPLKAFNEREIGRAEAELEKYLLQNGYLVRVEITCERGILAGIDEITVFYNPGHNKGGQKHINTTEIKELVSSRMSVQKDVVTFEEDLKWAG
jgi:stage III sporulation protein AF